MINLERGTQLRSFDAEKLWEEYDVEKNNQLSRPSAFKFLKDLADALDIPFDETIARNLMEICDRDGTGWLS